MSKLPVQLTLLIFILALLSGFYMKIPLIDNLIRAFIIYVIFSVLILLVYLLHNQSAYQMLKGQISQKQVAQKENASKSVTGESTNK
jgi:amino acid permease